MIALYQIADDYRNALSFYIDSEEDATALTTLLDEIADRFENKAANVVAYIRNLDAESDAYRTEEKRLAERRRLMEKRAENLKDYLAVQMRRSNMDECKAGLTTLKFVKTPWSVELDPGAKLPDKYVRYKDPEPDKKAIADALKSGESIDGARLVQGERLRIQ